MACGVQLLPVWVACCERFLRIDDPNYDSRAWCRLEPLLAAAFSFADHQTVIRPGFVNCWPDKGRGLSARLLDPRQGRLTNAADMNKIMPLVELAEASLASSGRQAKDVKVKCFQLPLPQEMDTLSEEEDRN